MSKRFALLTTINIDGVDTQVVNNVIVAQDAAWMDNAVDLSGETQPIGAGWRYVNGAFEAPPAEALPTPTQPRYITNLAMLDLAMLERFDSIELRQFKIVAAINPAAPVLEQQLSADIGVFHDKLMSAKYLDLDDPRLLAGLQSLEWLGVLPVGRAQQIIDAPVLDIERP
jgi:hypothetical protein